AGTRKFRRAAKAAMLRIVFGFELARRVVQRRGGQRRRLGRALFSLVFQPLMQFGGGIEDLAMPGFPKLADVLEDLHKAGTAITRVRWEVGPAVKRLQFRCEKNVQRPAALTAHGLDER